MKIGIQGLMILLAGVLAAQSGCAVTQKPGHGKHMRMVEPSTKSHYWLYLPDDYIRYNGRRPDRQRWPLVVTLHGLRPYDNALWQNKEWQEEADRYGFIVIAPSLETCDSLTMQLPLRDPTLPYVRADERAILAMMDDVFRRTNADPRRVLVTSFSSGGYLAHYMANQHPERFTVLAVRGSNFNQNLLSPAQVARYRNMPIGIFFGENDLAICQTESVQAIEWYRGHNFHVTAKKVSNLGHERKPQLAAALFAQAIGVTPKTPPDLGGMVMIDIPPAESGATASRTLPRPILPSPTTFDQRPSSVAMDQQDDMDNPSLRWHRPGERELIFNTSRKEPAATASRQPLQYETPVPGYQPVPPMKGTPRTSPTPKRPNRQPYQGDENPRPAKLLQ